jgi:S-adenosylmethionine:tRNA ribosyltransferase-isomerase
MLYAVAGKDLVREGYEEAIKAGYLWHEFGDSHLLLPDSPRTNSVRGSREIAFVR